MGRAPRIHKASEHEFAKLCSDAGAVPQKVSEDETGWDYIVEFPTLPFSGPAEMQPGARRAFVQVKSTVGSVANTKVTLSNMLRMAQEDVAWFVILMQRKHEGPSIVYAKHVWGDFMVEGLANIRRANQAGKKLHRHKMGVNFTPDDQHADDLLAWIEKQIEDVGEPYAARKLEMYRTCGYEDGHGTGILKFVDVEAEKLALAFVGLGDGIEAAFTFTPQRFGLPAKEPEIDLDSGIVQMEPLDGRPCKVRLRKDGKGPAIALDGKIFVPPMAKANPLMRYIRVSAQFLDLLYRPDGSFDLKLSLPREAPYRLSYLMEFAKATGWAYSGELDCAVWADGKRLDGGRIDLSHKPSRFNWLMFAEALETASRLAGQDLTCSLSDLTRCTNALSALHFLSSERKLRMEFEHRPGTLDAATDFFAYDLIGCGDKVICGLIRRPVIRNERTPDGRRRLEFGRPEIVESYVVDIHSEPRESLHADFEHALDDIGETAFGVSEIGRYFAGEDPIMFHTGEKSR